MASAVRLVHVSDTHCMHWEIEGRLALPDGDILVHTGDFTNSGSDEEVADFQKWLHEVAPRYRHIVIIPGNHDWRAALGRVTNGDETAADIVAHGYLRRRWGALEPGFPTNCMLLEHEEITLMGVRIFGSSWVPWHEDSNPESFCSKRAEGADLFEAWRQGAGGANAVHHRFGEIPESIDVLLTHGPAEDIMDCLGTPGQGWGSSRVLLQQIFRAKPRMHFFGHLHEQRGVWRKTATGYAGGIEYTAGPGAGSYPTTGPPPVDYPCELVSCNAMANHPDIENRKPCIAASGRLIAVDMGSAMLPPMEQAGQSRRRGEQVCIENTRHGKVLSCQDMAVKTLSRNIAGPSKFIVTLCPREPEAFVVADDQSGSYLSTDGRHLQLLNLEGVTIEDISVSEMAPNLLWRLLPCPHEPGSFYIVSWKFETFLDAVNGTDVQVWNNGGRSIDTVISQNTSHHAGNLRWSIQQIA